ncbi:MAG: ATPase [Haloarculaceae archaeon]
MTHLVAGAREVDAGKTTFTVGLLASLDGVGFKPRAGNDVWHHHDDYRRAIEEGRMVGKDARRLADASAADVVPEEINPVHRLWRPDPGDGGFLGRTGRRFVLDRVGDGYVVNATADVPDAAREALSLSGAPRVADVDELNEQIRSRHLPHLDALARRIEDTEPAVVESYGDVARPIRDLDVSRAAVVEPERVRIYDGDRYENACDVVSSDPREGRLEVIVRNVVDVIDPIETVELPPLTEDERADPTRVAGAYVEGYEALLT